MKIAVFGKPGGGKSTLSQQIAIVTSLPLYQLDLVQYRRGGDKVPDEEFLRLHAEILARDRWVIDGFGNPPSLCRNVARSECANLRREVSLDALLVGHKAASQEPILQAARLARK